MSLLENMKQAALDLPSTEVEVKQWNQKVTLRRLSIIERKEMFAMFEDNTKDVAPLLVSFSLVDDDGSKLHVKEGINEVYQGLVSGDNDVLELLFEKAEELSKITTASVEDIKKN